MKALVEISKAQASELTFIKDIEVKSDLGFWTPEDYLLEIGRADSLFYVAKIGQKTAGFILARLIIYKFIDTIYKEIEIYNIAVLRKFRRRSIASKLLNGIIEIGFEENVRKIFLEVRKSNEAAQEFYKKQDFEVFGVRKNFYTNPCEDAFLMCRLIVSI